MFSLPKKRFATKYELISIANASMMKLGKHFVNTDLPLDQASPDFQVSLVYPDRQMENIRANRVFCLVNIFLNLLFNILTKTLILFIIYHTWWLLEKKKLF